MPAYVLRVWLADRPGALGAVASRIGAVGGDVVGIEILERGAGRVIDELLLELPSEDRVSLMLAKLAELDAVDVEDVRAIEGAGRPLAEPLEVAADLLGARSVADLLAALAGGVASASAAEWVAVLDPDEPAVLSAAGSPPPAPWLEAFVAGTSAGAGPHDAPGASVRDVAWARLEGTGLVLLAGRSGRPYRDRERRQLAALARIAGQHWHHLVVVEGMRVHPTRFS
ncbi:MAG TPA: hypothetical protein VKV23_10230 [Acidimicrobiales bacterium]|nr:hypothetical protein [Acidimicrobiales bacterium]